MVLRIFDGKDEITLDDYLEFRDNLQELLWEYEYYQFDNDKRGHISNYDFCTSLYVHYFPFHLID